MVTDQNGSFGDHDPVHLRPAAAGFTLLSAIPPRQNPALNAAVTSPVGALPMTKARENVRWRARAASTGQVLPSLIFVACSCSPRVHAASCWNGKESMMACRRLIDSAPEGPAPDDAS